MTIKPRALTVLATTALALAATAGGAQAATRATASPATPAPAAPALRGVRIALGATGSLDGNAFTEAPNGAVFFSRGAVVYVVEGSHAPGVALHAGGMVLALGANDAELFVQSGLRVTE